MKQKKVLILLIWTACCGLAHAAWQPIVQNYSPQQYESGTQNWQLAQAQNGWIYSANNYGVMEFDGQTWRTYGLSNSSIVRRVRPDHHGVLLAGGTDEFGFFLADEDKNLTYHSISARVGDAYRPFGEIWGIEENQGTAYFQSRHYIFITDSAGRMEVVNPGAIIYASLVHHNELYVATDHGIYLYAGKRLHRLEGSELVEGKTICAMAATQDGRVLIGTDFAGIYQYDEQGIRPFPTEVDNFLKRNQLYSIATDGNKLALGTVLMGLAVTDTDGHLEQFINRNHGLQNNTVLSLLFDRDHNLWVGLDQGIDHISLSWPIEFLHEDPPYGVGYAFHQVGKDAYYGTNQGLYYSKNDQQELELIEGTAGQVWRIVEIESTLFCCHNRGLFEVRKQNNSPSHLVRRLDIPDGVWNVHRYEDGVAIACTYSGFYLLKKAGKEWVVGNSIPGYDETALYTYMDEQKQLWTWAASSHSYYRIAQAPDGDWSITEDSPTAPERIQQIVHQEYCTQTPYGPLQLQKMQVTLNQQPIFTRKDFFVGGFSNIAFSNDQSYAIVGGVDGFYRINLLRASQPQISLPWEVRPTKVIIPWYKTWWAISLMILISLAWVLVLFQLLRHYILVRDARIAAKKEAEIHQQEMKILQLENDKAQFELQHKTQELNNALLERVNRNEIIAWVQEDLRRISDSLQHRDVETAQRYLRQLQGRLSVGNKRQEKDWKRFEDNFDAVNETFLSRLKELYPWMNEDQHRLCVYIYMGLQTKEIGPLLHLSTRGVEMMRYRMRKQMKLDDRLNLHQYFEDLAQNPAETN